MTAITFAAEFAVAYVALCLLAARGRLGDKAVAEAFANWRILVITLTPILGRQVRRRRARLALQAVLSPRPKSSEFRRLKRPTPVAIKTIRSSLHQSKICGVDPLIKF